MSPKVSEQHLADRRQQILDAAVTSFSRKGFHEATIEDIRLEASLSRGAVYHYFKSKEDIIDGLRQRSADETDLIFADVAEIEEPMDSLIGLVDSTVDRMINPASLDANRLALFLWAESLVNRRLMDGQLSSSGAYRRRVEASVRGAQARGHINSDLEPSAIALVIIAALIGLQQQLSWMPGLDLNMARRVLIAMLTGDFRSSGLRPFKPR